jgi:hypothetical protein
MKLVTRVFSCLFTFAATIGLACSSGDIIALDGSNVACRSSGGPTANVVLLCVMQLPAPPATGSLPITSGTKLWVDEAGKRLFVTDVNNAAVDIFDAFNHVYSGRTGGFVGNATTGGGTATTNGAGPNSIMLTTLKDFVVTDGNSNVMFGALADMAVTKTISTAIAACDGGTASTHYCGRTNEIDYDSDHQILIIQNPTPLTLAAPHTALPAYATFISAVAPYPILGTITFTGSGGIEAGVYDAVQQRVLIPLQYKVATFNKDTIVVINAVTRTIEKKFGFDCQVIFGAPSTTGVNDLSLGPSQKAIMPLCGKPVIFSTATGAVLKGITQVGGGNETWYNPNDNRFYVTGADAVTGVTSLGVIDAATNTWLQNIPAAQATNPTALAYNNHAFAVIQASAANVADANTDTTVCATMGGTKGRGCIAVFGHQ